MAMYYSDESQSENPWTLPDLEVFFLSAGCYPGVESGWYYWHCFPGCLPDSEKFGPFESEAEALADARECAA